MSSSNQSSIHDCEVCASFNAAIKAGEDAHLLTVGSPTRGLAFRLALGRLGRDGQFHAWQPNAFFIWRGRRLG